MSTCHNLESPEQAASTEEWSWFPSLMWADPSRCEWLLLVASQKKKDHDRRKRDSPSVCLASLLLLSYFSLLRLLPISSCLLEPEFQAPNMNWGSVVLQEPSRSLAPDRDFWGSRLKDCATNQFLSSRWEAAVVMTLISCISGSGTFFRMHYEYICILLALSL